jgi:hypothetical protein
VTVKPSNAVKVPGGATVEYDPFRDGYVVTVRGVRVLVPTSHIHAAYNIVCPVVDLGIEEDE